MRLKTLGEIIKMARKVETPKCDICKKSSVYLKDKLGCLICPICEEYIEDKTYSRKLIARIGTLLIKLERVRKAVIE